MCSTGNCSIFCNNLNGKRMWKWIVTCIRITESFCCTLETNTILLINYLLLLSCPVMSNSLWQHGLQNTRLPCSSLSLRTCSSSVQFSCSVGSDSLQPHGLQHTRLLCPSPTPRASNSCPSSQWCHPTISSSVVPFSFCLQSFPASGSFLASQFFASGGQSIGVLASASILPMNIQDRFSLWLTGLISL